MGHKTTLSSLSRARLSKEVSSLFNCSLLSISEKGTGSGSICPFLCKSQLRPDSLFILIQSPLMARPLLASPCENLPTDPSPSFRCFSMVWEPFQVLSSPLCLHTDLAGALCCSDSFSPFPKDLCPSPLSTCPSGHLANQNWLPGQASLWPRETHPLFQQYLCCPLVGAWLANSACL